jgi:DegV family protein with EDD domain
VARIKIITDSASDLPVDEATRLNVDVIPLSIRFGDEEFVDRRDITPTAFWERCASSDALPETAAPSPGAFQDAFTQAQADGFDGVVVIAISSKLSATYQSALAAKEAMGDYPVEVIDSQAVTMAEGLLVITVAEAASKGASFDECVTLTKSLIARLGVVGALDTLEHLKRGGRIGSAAALLGSMLSIKPLLTLRDGEVVEDGRQRTRAKALDHLARDAAEASPFERLAVVHGAADDAVRLITMLAHIECDTPLVVTDIGPVVGTHAGPGIIGVCWIEKV